MGCTADVYKLDYGMNAYYDSRNHSIVLLGLDNLPLNWQRFIVAHEAGHCLQAQAHEFDTLQARGRYELEWDADRVAIQVMADRYGLDGSEINHDIWAELYRWQGFEGSEWDSHGWSTHRIARGWLNRVMTILETL